MCMVVLRFSHGIFLAGVLTGFRIFTFVCSESRDLQLIKSNTLTDLKLDVSCYNVLKLQHTTKGVTCKL